MKVSKELKREIGNAFAAYGDILHGVLLGTSIPSKFEALKLLSEQELKERISLLREFYLSLEEEN